MIFLISDFPWLNARSWCQEGRDRKVFIVCSFRASPLSSIVRPSATIFSSGLGMQTWQDLGEVVAHLGKEESWAWVIGSWWRECHLLIPVLALFFSVSPSIKKGSHFNQGAPFIHTRLFSRRPVYIPFFSPSFPLHPPRPPSLPPLKNQIAKNTRNSKAKKKKQKTKTNVVSITTHLGWPGSRE